MKSIDDILDDIDDIPEPPAGLMEDVPMAGLMILIGWCEKNIKDLCSGKPNQRKVKARFSRYHGRLLEIYDIRKLAREEKEKKAEEPVVVFPDPEPKPEPKPEVKPEVKPDQSEAIEKIAESAMV